MLAPSDGGLILYQAYGNLYAMTGRKAHLLEDKQIPSVGVFDEVYLAFGGNTRDLDSFGKETDKTSDLHQHFSRLSSQRLETASQDARDAITIHPMTKSFTTTASLNSLQPEWSKYVTLTRQSHTLNKEHFYKLYDYLSPCEPYVNASRAKRNARNHDLLDLVENSNANHLYSHVSPSYSRSPQPYYVTHPLSVHDYDDDYQGEIQVVIQYGRVDIQSKNVGYDGNGSMNIGRLNGNQATTVGNGFAQKNVENEENVQRIPRTTSTLGKTNV
ncbi:hypothetical protein Tco_1295356 [Tanacetum coccineum]